jgi:hypothetical protein
MDVKGALSLDGFQLTGRDSRNLFSAGNITANIASLNIDKQSYILSSLVASNYSTQFIMHKDGRTNFDGLFYDEPEVSLETTSESVSSNIYDQRERVTITTESSTSPLSGMTLRIGDLIFLGSPTEFEVKAGDNYRLTIGDNTLLNFDIK